MGFNKGKEAGLAKFVSLQLIYVHLQIFKKIPLEEGVLRQRAGMK
jgi:hypothetical protein